MKCFALQADSPWETHTSSKKLLLFNKKKPLQEMKKFTDNQRFDFKDVYNYI